MQILTYNIWNSDVNFEKRLELVCKLVENNGVDVAAFQEVRDKATVDYIQRNCKFGRSFWKKYDDCEEGLAILSKYPIVRRVTNWDSRSEIHNCGVMRTLIDYEGKAIGITNVHLDYESALNREIETVKMIRMIEAEDISEYEILLGDFSSSPSSSVYRYLTGQQSLENHATSWIDLASSNAHRNRTSLEITLDFVNNPRWDDEEVLDVPARYDWILIKNPYPKKYPLLNKVAIIGKERVEGITASDHYGVLCDISF